MSRLTTPRLLIIVTSAFALLIIVALFGAYLYAGNIAGLVDRRAVERTHDRQAESVGRCIAGNRLRGLELLDRRDRGRAAFERALEQAPIVNCALTIYRAGGVDVPLSERQTRRYLRELARGQTPIVLADGTVR